jgi:hypothetical protein
LKCSGGGRRRPLRNFIRNPDQAYAPSTVGRVCPGCFP